MKKLSWIVTIALIVTGGVLYAHPATVSCPIDGQSMVFVNTDGNGHCLYRHNGNGDPMHMASIACSD